MKESKYKKEFSNYIEIMNEALKKDDFMAYEAAKRMLDETVAECKEDKALLSEMNTNNFGILNHIFMQELPSLLKTNKKAVREVIKTIKEDKNLLSQFNFYNVIRTKYKGKAATLTESKNALEMLANISANEIDQKSVIKSNRKLRNVMVENGVVPCEFIDEEDKNLYESGHIILTRKKNAENMLPLLESYDNVCKYMEKHKNDTVKDGKTISEMIEEFENKLKTNLNESEISFVQQITDFKSPIAEKRKEKLFNKLREDCISAVDSLLKENSSDELNAINSQLKEMKFNKDNIVGDIAKLLEIRDILLDK